MKIGDKVTLVEMLNSDRSVGRVNRATVIVMRRRDFVVEVVADDPHHAGVKTLCDHVDKGRTWAHGWEDNPALQTVAALLQGGEMKPKEVEVNVPDGEKVTMMCSAGAVHGPNDMPVVPVRAIAVGEHAFQRIHGSAETLNAAAQNIGFLRPDREGTLWCRGWDGPAVNALMTVNALVFKGLP